jgi:hypothetical protein
MANNGRKRKKFKDLSDAEKKKPRRNVKCLRVRQWINTKRGKIVDLPIGSTFVWINSKGNCNYFKVGKLVVGLGPAQANKLQLKIS